MIDEHVRQNHIANLQPPIEQPSLGKTMKHVAAEAADRSLLHRDQHFVVAGEVENEIAVERLHEAGVGDRGGKPEAGQLIRRL